MATAFLVPKNFATGTLAADINASVTEITLETGEAANFPSTFPFHIVIDEEIMTVTEDVSGADGFVVTRAAEGTTGVSHYIGAEVKLAITAEYLAQAQAAINVLEGLILDPANMPNLVLGDGSAATKIELFNASAQKALINAVGTLLALSAPGATNTVDILSTGGLRVNGGDLHGPAADFLKLFSARGIYLYLDKDNNETAYFQIYNGAGKVVFNVSETGAMTLSRMDSSSAQEINFYLTGASRTFRWNTLSTNLQLQDDSGEIVRFNFSGTRFPKDLKPLYNWNGADPNFGANLGSSSDEYWLGLFVKNIYQLGAQISPPITLEISTTPSILNGKVFKVPVLSAANIAVASFANVANGQEIILLGVDQPTYTWSIAASNTFSTINGTWTSAAGATLHLIYDSALSKWFEISRR